MYIHADTAEYYSLHDWDITINDIYLQVSFLSNTRNSKHFITPRFNLNRNFNVNKIFVIIFAA